MRPFALLAAAAALLSVCCAEEVATSQVAAPTAAGRPVLAGGEGVVAPGDTMVPENMDSIELLVGGARPGDSLPMLVALHGKLGSPENISRILSGLHTPARLIAPRGAAFGSGYVWWDLHIKDADPRRFSAAAREAARRMDAFVRQVVRRKPTLGKPVVVGFSQGAILAYSLVVRDPDLVGSAFPLSGMLPLGLEPPGWPARASIPPVHAFHGDADPVVPIAFDRDSVARLRALGVPVSLTEVRGMPHILGPVELSGVLPEVDDALRREAARGPSAAPR